MLVLMHPVSVLNDSYHSVLVQIRWNLDVGVRKNAESTSLYIYHDRQGRGLCPAVCILSEMHPTCQAFCLQRTKLDDSLAGKRRTLIWCWACCLSWLTRLWKLALHDCNILRDVIGGRWYTAAPCFGYVFLFLFFLAIWFAICYM